MKRAFLLSLLITVPNLFSFSALAQDTTGSAAEQTASNSSDDVMGESLTDLFNTEVTSVSKTNEKASETASAVYVISSEDIRRMGATSVPEALRGVPGLQVGKVNNHIWAIGARGFNNRFSNKLLVLIDGRSIYSPVFSGVYWDLTNLVLEDIDRIEVIRGPGASIWGANAVNGVINIITKDSKFTEGSYVNIGHGMTEEAIAEARHGGKVGEKTTYRVYSKFLKWSDSPKSDTQNTVGTPEATQGTAYDEGNNWQTGFRVDSAPTDEDNVAVHANAYRADADMVTNEYPEALTDPLLRREYGSNMLVGTNVLGRWAHTLSADSALDTQIYFSNDMQSDPTYKSRVNTIDTDIQHTISLTDNNKFIWGGGYRYIWDEYTGTWDTSFTPDNYDYDIINIFAQDQMPLFRDNIMLTVGSKLEYNDFSGGEFQPTARIAWQPVENHTLWGAVSRASRTPSRSENSIFYTISSGRTTALNLATTYPLVGNADLDAETLTAYEIGHKAQLSPKFSVDSTAFYNDYDELIGFEVGARTPMQGKALVFPLYYTNGGEARTYGFETSSVWQVKDNWRLAANYTYFHMDINQKGGGVGTIRSTGDFKRLAPANQVSLQSTVNLPHNIEFDNSVYYVDDLITTPTDAYIRVDSHIAWHYTDNITLTVVGQNLFDEGVLEFPAGTIATGENQRNFYGMASVKF